MTQTLTFDQISVRGNFSKEAVDCVAFDYGRVGWDARRWVTANVVENGVLAAEVAVVGLTMNL